MGQVRQGVWAGLALVGGVLGTAQVGAAPRDGVRNTLETIIADMTLPHAARLHGVPEHYSWARGPEVGMGNTPGSFRAIIAWGQLYEPAEGNPARNTRVQIRNIRTYVLSKREGRWQRVQASAGVEGAAYREDFAGDVNRPADVRPEASGGISVSAGEGHNFHFWTEGGRALIEPADIAGVFTRTAAATSASGKSSPCTLIEPADIAGVFTTVQARLIRGDPRQPDDRARARLLLGMGADYWLDQSAAWDNFKTNGGVGAGRMKWGTPAWQAFNMTTLGAAQLRQNPPPLE